MTRATAKYTITAEDKTKNAFKSVKSSLGGLGKAALGVKSALAAVVGIGGLSAVAMHALKAGDQVQKMSLRIGASTESLSQYQHVAELTGVSFNTLTTSWQRMSRRVAEAAMGTGEAKNALAELGIDAQKLNKLAPEKQFEVLADAFEEVDIQSDKVRLAMKLFDTEGVSLLQTMEGGSEAIKAMRGEADALGMTLSQSSANQMAEANDSMTKLKNTFRGLTTQLAVDFGPVLASIAEWLREAIPTAIMMAKHAVLGLKIAFNEVMASIASGLESFYSMMGKLPGSLGEPYRQAAQYFNGLNQQLTNTVKLHQQTIKKMHLGVDGTKTQALFSYKKGIVEVTEASKELQSVRISPEEQMKAVMAGEKDNMAEALASVKESKKEVGELTSMTEEAAERMQSSFAEFLFNPFEDGLTGMLDGFTNTLKRMAAESAATQLFGGLKSSGGSMLGSLFGGLSLPGFATGGGFTVGGFGGTDSQLVAFRATPGESVSVNTPNQKSSNRSVHVTNNINVSAPNGQITQQSLNQLQSKLYNSMQSAARSY